MNSAFSHLSLIVILEDGHYYLKPKDDETAAQRGEMTCPRAQSEK